MKRMASVERLGQSASGEEHLKSAASRRHSDGSSFRTQIGLGLTDTEQTAQSRHANRPINLPLV
jgi:hypothetical protein